MSFSLSTHRRHYAFARLFAAALIVSACGGEEESRVRPLASGEPLTIALLAPSLPNDGGIPDAGKSPFDYAVAKVNEAGGIAGGRPVKLVPYTFSLTDNDFDAVSAEVLADPNVVATIGLAESSQLMTLAPSFIGAERLLIAPNATADELLRAFGGGQYFWRTKPSDIGQAELLVTYAKRVHAKKLGLVTSLDTGGMTFFTWMGFFATEHGYDAKDLHIEPLTADADCTAPMAAVLADAPDVVFVGAAQEVAGNCIIHAWADYRKANPTKNPRLVFADAGYDYTEYGMSAGQDAEGLEGFATVGPLGNTFDEDYAAWAGKAGSGKAGSGPNGRSSHDAVLLLAYGLDRTNGVGGAALDNALRELVDTRGTKVDASVSGIAAGLNAIEAGALPDITGETGELEYLSGLYVDPANAHYGRWSYEYGGYIAKETYWTGEPGFLSAAKALAFPSDATLAAPNLKPGFTPAKPQSDTWALVMSFSGGWENYRHQADGLRQFQALLALGIPRDHIVLIGADDLATSPNNTLPGQVRNQANGPNIYANVTYDYTLNDVTAADVLNILKGQKTATTPTVLGSTDASNVYVFFSGHGGTSGMPVGAGSVSEGLAGGTMTTLSPADFRETLCTMQDEKRYRRVLVAIEACYSGAFGSVFNGGLLLGCNGDGVTPGDPLLGVMLMTAANTVESSYAAQYDKTLKAWVADQFADRLAMTLFEGGGTSVPAYDLFKSIASTVSGAHVSLYNEGAYGNATQDTFAEIFKP